VASFGCATGATAGRGGRCPLVLSIAHEDLVRLFDERPELASELLQRCLKVAIPRYRHAASEKDSIKASRPVELHVDAVVSCKRSNGKAVYAVVVEVQLRTKQDKLYSWPVYVTSVRRRLRCPVALLVVTPSESVARWARRSISIGPSATLTPSVVLLGPEVVPAVTSRMQAARIPELALLSVWAHGHGDPERAVRIAKAAFAATRQAANARRLGRESAEVYSWAIREALGPIARKVFEMEPDIERFFDAATRRKLRKAQAKGRAEGRAEAREQAKAEALRTKRDAVVAVLKARDLPVTDRQRARIDACTDGRQLDTLLRNAATAASTTAVFSQRPLRNTLRTSSTPSIPIRRSRSRGPGARSRASRTSPR
jgi:hypothetical protein